ncbi:autotransporter outer membrane beta-barrel domain-containing protein [Roseococcus sp. YIM B11640]|uniref:autotransporter outer membrane beta-barrel domain-containing protein n=1 Tax=Roseococcus sp. YIM B11640 TaxID=3133973 RepID=UPI003C798701
MRQALLAGVAMMLAPSAWALDATWSGSVSGDFGLGANWVGGAVPDGTASFGAGAATRHLDQVALGGGFGGFNFAGTTGPFTFDNVAGAFTGAGIVNADAFAPVLNVAPGATLAFRNLASMGNAQIVLGAGSTLDLSQHGGTVPLASISGAASSVVDLGARSLMLPSGTYAANLAGSGTIYIQGEENYVAGSAADVTILGNVPQRIGIGYSTRDVAAGRTVPYATQLQPAVLRIGNGGTTGSATGDIANFGALIFNRSDAITYGGVISGSGGVRISSDVTFTGEHTYSGVTVIDPAGTLRVGNGGTTGALPDWSICWPHGCFAGRQIVNDGTLIFERSDTHSSSSNITGSGATIIPSGELVLERGGSIAQGSIRIASGATLSASFVSGSVINDGTLRFLGEYDYNRGTYGIFRGSLTGAGSVSVGPNAGDGITMDGESTLGGSVTIGGNSRLFLFGTHRFDGGVFVGPNAVLTVGNAGDFLVHQRGSGTLASDVVLNGGTISFENPGTQSFANRISGSGQVLVDANSRIVSRTRLTLTGDIALSAGAVTVGYDSNWLAWAWTPQYGRQLSTTVLQIGDGGTKGSVSADIVNYATLAFARSDAYTYGGTISGNGLLRQLGPGVLILPGTHTYTGPTEVAGGTLLVNGSIASSSGVSVLTGATLGGTGTLPSVSVQAGGTFAPGASIGTATVKGNLMLAPGSITAMEVQGAAADRINVSGMASLGGTLRLVPLGGNYAFNTPYTLIAAQGGRSGQFATVNTQGSFGAGIVTEVSYTSQAVNLTLAPAPLLGVGNGTGVNGDGPVFAGLPNNPANVASALDAMRASGGDLSGFFGLYNLPANQIGLALSQLTGEVATATTGMGLLAGQEFMSTMLDPFREGRETLLGSRIRPGESADGDDWGGPLPQRYAVWGQATGAYSRLSGDGSAGSSTRSARGAGFAMGFDMAVGQQSMVGVALAAGETSASLSGGMGSSRSWTGQLGVNGQTRAGSFTLAGAVALSLLDVDSKRTIYFAGGDQARADYGARVWSMRMEGRHDGLARGPWRLQPLLGLQAQVVDTDGFTERGSAMGLRVNGSTNSNVRTELGVQVEAIGRMSGRLARGFLRAAWAHYLMREQSSTMAFLAFPGTGFAAQGAQLDRDSAVLALGGEAEVAPGWMLGARLDSELSPSLSSIAGTIRLRHTF